MKIDEAIAQQKLASKFKREMWEESVLREKNEHLISQAEEHDQIVAWLEELKAIKEKGRYVQGFRAGYKVAIDDFTNRMLEEGVIGLVQFAKIKEIAEQLKEQK